MPTARSCRPILPSIVAVWLVAIASPVRAEPMAPGCDAASGKTIFEDPFKDSTGGWNDDQGAAYGKPGLSLTLSSKEDRWTFVNQGFTAGNADYCLETVVPKPASSGNDASVGLVFLYVDDENYYRISVWNDKTISLVRIVEGDAKILYSDTNDAVSVAPGSAAVLRAVVRDGLLTATVNGIEIKKVRIQMPEKPGEFGVEVQTDKPVARPATYQFDRIRVSALS